MKVQVQAKEILEYIKEGKDCKIEVSKQGDAYVLPLEAYGFEDAILTQVFAGYEEVGDAIEFISWLKDTFDPLELEARHGQLVKIEII